MVYAKACGVKALDPLGKKLLLQLRNESEGWERRSAEGT